ncbi:MAG: hypothetical protein OXR03_11430, partial [Rhodospirillaceae bacterium]|nr:hypothetical protein [Rhodospirillaceae bacterium]
RSQVSFTADGSVGGSFTNEGLLSITGAAVTGSGIGLASTGTVSLDGGSLTDNGGLLTNAGQVSVTAGIATLGGATVSNLAGGTISVADGATLQQGGTLLNAGELSLSGALAMAGGTAVNDGVLSFSTGTLSLSGGAAFDQNTDVTLGTGSEIALDAATLGGSGTLSIDGAVTFANDGVLALTAVNEGTVTTGNGRYDVSGSLATQGSGTVDLDGSNTLGGGGAFSFANVVDLTDDTVETLTAVSASGGLSLSNTAVNGTLTAGSGATVTFGGTVAVTGGGAFTHDAVGSTLGTVIDIADLTNTGTLALAGGTITSNTFSNTGFLDVAASSLLDPNAAGTATNSGTLAVRNGATLSFGDGVADGVLANSGTIDLSNGSELDVTGETLANSGLINVEPGALLDQSGGVLDNSGSINIGSGAGFQVANGIEFLNSGTFSTDSAITLNLNGASNVNSGSLVLNNTSVFDFVTSGGVLSNSGIIDINNSPSGLVVNATGGDGTLHNLAAGTITVDGTGTITTGTGVVFQDDGTTNFGSSPGLLTINGDYTKGRTSFMELELGGLTAGDEFDQLTVNGSLSAGGTVQVSEFGGFDVSVGDSFTVVQATNIADSFDKIDGLDVGGGVVLDAVQSASSVILTGVAVTLQGSGAGDTLTGGAGVDIVSAGAGDDTITGNGGADLVHAGDGDDIFIAADTGFGHLDGGADFDLVDFSAESDASFDLRPLRGDQLSNIERIDISGAGTVTLSLDGATVFSATGGTNSLTGTDHTLIIDGDGADSVDAGSGWANNGTTTIAEINGYTVFEHAETGAQMFVDSAVSVTLT